MNAASAMVSQPASAATMHLAAEVRVVQPGFLDTPMRVVFAVEPDGAVTPFAPLIQFFRERGVQSVSQQRDLCWAMRLFLSFVAAYQLDVASVPTEALLDFAQALRTNASAGRLAHAGLRWKELSYGRASRCLALVTRFTDWLSNRTGEVPPNGWREASTAERVVLARRFERRTANALLKHVAMRRRDAEIGHTRTVTIRAPRDDAPGGTVYAFETKAFEELVRRGFSKRAMPDEALHKRVRLRDLMITILMHAGGLRASEPFHLYVDDVTIDPRDPRAASVRVFHPERGAAPEEGGKRWRDRAHYLHDRWGIEPRNRVRGRLHAGWKGLALSDQRRRFAQVHFYPAHYAHLFLELFRAYLTVRPRGRHPFLFVSEREQHRGQPYTIAAFEQAHARAVRRIGLIPEKYRGTTPHAHRHAFGRALSAAQLDRLTIQRALHHRDPSSQDVYTIPDSSAVNDALSEASRRVFGDPAPTSRRNIYDN